MNTAAIPAAIATVGRTFIPADLYPTIGAALPIAIAKLRLLHRLNLLNWGSDCGITSAPTTSLAVIAAPTTIVAALCHFNLRYGADFRNTNGFSLSCALFEDRRCLHALCLNGGSLRLFGLLFGALFGTFRAEFRPCGAHFIASRLRKGRRADRSR